MKNVELYLELINGIVGITIFLITLAVFKFTTDHPELIRGYFFLRGGNLSRPFFFLMTGMLVWGVRELYKVLEIAEKIELELFYEVSELISALFLLIGMSYFLNITRNK